jgi:nitroreductase
MRRIRVKPSSLLWFAVSVGCLATVLPAADALQIPLRETASRPSCFERSPLFSSPSSPQDENDDNSALDFTTAFDRTVSSRYACTRFQRFDGNMTSIDTPSPSDHGVVKQALEALDLARRAPSGFNAQPYKCLLVYSEEAKAALASYCCGRNAHRVRDSDCTVVFLADRECMWSLGKYQQMLESQNPTWKERKWGMRKIKALILLFSQGLPLPKFLAGPISFGVRLAVSILAFITRSWYPLPSWSSAETWSQKNTMLVAMTYLLGCTSRNLATCPMEGYNVAGIRHVLQIPRRYTIPLIVATGTPYQRETIADDAGMSHGLPNTAAGTPRYPTEAMIFGNAFGNGMSLE